MRSFNFTFGFLVIIVLVLIVNGTPLDDYVNKLDPNYNFKVLTWTYKGDGYTMYCINMTSQKWLTENDTNNPYWYHAINVAVPDKLTVKDTGFLYIALGGNNPNYIPDMTINDDFNWFVSLMAVSTGSISAVIRNIPNNDPAQKRRTEDAVIAWTWKMFLTIKSDQPEWLLRLPMTKAVVRGFDTLNSFGKQFGANLEKFVICGESKRGWTTWTTAAVDKRVIGFAPIVMDLLNMKQNLLHHYQSLGGWTFAFSDYYTENITSLIDTDAVQNMANIIDPYVYRDRYANIPKYIVTTSSDEFFIPDDSDYYFKDLHGEKFLRILANAEHELIAHRPSLFFGMRAFYLSILQNYKRPNITWSRAYTKNGGIITLYTDTEPLVINVYYAVTLDDKRRDFRLVQQDPNGPPGQGVPHPIVYQRDSVKNPKSGVYVAEYENPIKGWRNFFIQATFKGPEDSNFEFTSENFIIPDVFPYPKCSGSACYGTLV